MKQVRSRLERADASVAQDESVVVGRARRDHASQLSVRRDVAWGLWIVYCRGSRVTRRDYRIWKVMLFARGFGSEGFWRVSRSTRGTVDMARAGSRVDSERRVMWDTTPGMMRHRPAISGTWSKAQIDILEGKGK
jgi:hypothetical protein